MKRNATTGAPDFYTFARSFLHTYLPTIRRLSPKTVEAYRISLECFLTFLTDRQHVDRACVSFDHFDRPRLKAWMAWLADDKHYSVRTIALRVSAIKAFLGYAAAEDVSLMALSQAARILKAPAAPRKPIGYSPQTRLGPSWPRSQGAPGNHAATGCCSSCSTTPRPGSAKSPPLRWPTCH